MSYVVNKDMCIGCSECVGACPMEAIRIDEDGKATIDADICANCGCCGATCPNGAINE